MWTQKACRVNNHRRTRGSSSETGAVLHQPKTEIWFDIVNLRDKTIYAFVRLRFCQPLVIHCQSKLSDWNTLVSLRHTNLYFSNKIIISSVWKYISVQSWRSMSGICTWKYIKIMVLIERYITFVNSIIDLALNSVWSSWILSEILYVAMAYEASTLMCCIHIFIQMSHTMNLKFWQYSTGISNMAYHITTVFQLSNGINQEIWYKT